MVAWPPVSPAGDHQAIGTTAPIQDPLALYLLDHEVPEGTCITVAVADGKIAFSTRGPTVAEAEGE